MFLLGVLVDWRTFLFFEGLGVVAAMLANKIFAGVWYPELGNQGGLTLFLSLIFVLSVSVIFIRKKPACPTAKSKNQGIGG